MKKTSKLFIVVLCALGMFFFLAFLPQAGLRFGNLVSKVGFEIVAKAAALQNSRINQTEGENESENLVVRLCDGETKMEIADAKAGEVLSPEKARQVAFLMKEAYAEQQAKQASKWTERDRMTWEREQKRVMDEGKRLFHDWQALGGTIGISCDMCHPDASNTHPETYPKFQTQLKKVAAFRDMINWCIENPMKGKPLALDDPKMLALESYMTAQRKGQVLAPGQH